MGAEDAPQHVQLVDHDVAQPHEERGPAGVVGEQRRRGASRGWSADVGVAPGPGPLLGGAVAVVGGGDEARHVEVGEAPAAGPGPAPWWGRAERGAGPRRAPTPPRRSAPGSRATCPTPCRWRRRPTCRPGRGRWPRPGGSTAPATPKRRLHRWRQRAVERGGAGGPGREPLEVHEAAVPHRPHQPLEVDHNRETTRLSFASTGPAVGGRVRLS